MTSPPAGNRPTRSETTPVTVGGVEARSFPGAVVVIDVIRAFTSAAAAFGVGAREIRCVESIERALELGAIIDGSVVMGEERGQPPEGFDLGNSPLQFDEIDLEGRVVVQRTSNGTRGLAQVSAPLVLAASAVNLGATALRAAAMPPVHLVCTGSTSEDRACADHLAALLGGGAPDPDVTCRRVLDAADEHRAFWTRQRSDAEFAEFEADIAACAEVDRYPFAMIGRRDGDQVVLTRHDG